VNYSTVLEIDQQLNYEALNLYKYKPGLNFGGFWMHDFHKYFGLEAELIGKILGVNTTSPTTTMNYYYAALPISLRFNIPDDFFVRLGAEPSYFVSGTLKNITGRIPSTEAEPFFSLINDLDIQSSAGIGWQAKDKLIFTLDFNRSISPISEEFPLRHQSIQFSIKYLLKENVNRILSE